MSWLVGNCSVGPFLLEVLRLNFEFYGIIEIVNILSLKLKDQDFLRYDFDFFLNAIKTNLIIRSIRTCRCRIEGPRTNGHRRRVDAVSGCRKGGSRRGTSTCRRRAVPEISQLNSKYVS